MKRFFLVTALCSVLFFDAALSMKSDKPLDSGAPAGSPPSQPASDVKPGDPTSASDTSPDNAPKEPLKKDDGEKDFASFLNTVGRMVGAGPQYFFDFGLNAWNSGNYAHAIGTFGVAYKTIHLMPYVGSHLREFFSEMPGHLAESIGERPTYHVVKNVNGVLDGAILYTFSPELERKYNQWRQSIIHAKAALDDSHNNIYERASLIWAIATGILANYAAESAFVKKLENSAAEKIKTLWEGTRDSKKELKKNSEEHKQELPLYVNGKLISSTNNESLVRENAVPSLSGADLILTINGHQPSTLLQYAKAEGSKMVIHYIFYKVGQAVLNSALMWHQKKGENKKL